MGTAGKYAAGIGGGAASGAALGSEILPGWGTLIGGVIGAGVGAIGAGYSADAEEKKAREAAAEAQRLADEQKKLDWMRLAQGNRAQNMAGLNFMAQNTQQGIQNFRNLLFR